MAVDNEDVARWSRLGSMWGNDAARFGAELEVFEPTPEGSQEAKLFTETVRGVVFGRRDAGHPDPQRRQVEVPDRLLGRCEEALQDRLVRIAPRLVVVAGSGRPIAT